MNRRTFLCGLTLGTHFAPLVDEAQQPEKVYRFYRQEYVVFLRAAEGRIAFLREYFDPTRAAKAMNAPILDRDS